MDEHLGPVSSPPVGSWPGLQLQAYVSSQAESLTSNQKVDHYLPRNIIVLVLLCWSLLGSRCWVRLLMVFFPAAYIKLPGPVRASQQGGRTDWISLWFRCAVFSENRISPSHSGGWPRSIVCIVLGFSQDIPDWKKKQSKKRKLREIFHTCHQGFCKPKVSGRSVVLCVG